MNPLNFPGNYIHDGYSETPSSLIYPVQYHEFHNTMFRRQYNIGADDFLFHCECGSVLRRGSITRHCSTTSHIDAMYRIRIAERYADGLTAAVENPTHPLSVYMIDVDVYDNDHMTNTSYSTRREIYSRSISYDSLGQCLARSYTLAEPFTEDENRNHTDCTICYNSRTSEGIEYWWQCKQCSNMNCDTCFLNIIHMENPRCPFCRDSIESIETSRWRVYENTIPPQLPTTTSSSS